MTTIKIYNASNDQTFMEVQNKDVDLDYIAIDCSFEGLDDIYSFFLDKEDAIKLMQYLKEQFNLSSGILRP